MKNKYIYKDRQIYGNKLYDNIIQLLIPIISLLYNLLGKKTRNFIYVVSHIWRQAMWAVRLGEAGRGGIIRRNITIENPENVRLGYNVTIGEFVHIYGGGGVEIGDNTMIATHVAITSLGHDRKSEIYRDTVTMGLVKIGANVWVGSGATILPGVSIGCNAIIGAGAVVTKDVDPDTIVVGIPAKPILQNMDESI